MVFWLLRVLGRAVALAFWVAIWIGVGLIDARVSEARPWHGAAAFGLFGLMWGIHWMARDRRRAAEGSAPAHWGPLPPGESKDFHRDVAECEAPIDDVMERWHGRLPSACPSPVRPKEDGIVDEVRGIQKNEKAGDQFFEVMRTLIKKDSKGLENMVDLRRLETPLQREAPGATPQLVIGTPPYEHRMAYVQGRTTAETDRAALEARQKLADIQRRMSRPSPNPTPIGFRWARVHGCGPICEVIGRADEGTFIVQWFGGGVERFEGKVLIRAYPKKGEWWYQEACSSCNLASPAEVCMMADGTPTMWGRVVCGCLSPLNHGCGPDSFRLHERP